MGINLGTLQTYLRSHTLSLNQAVLNRVNTLTNITYKDYPTIDELGNMAVYVKSIGCKALLRLDWRDFTVHRLPDRAQCNPNSYANHKLELTLSGNHQTPGEVLTASTMTKNWQIKLCTITERIIVCIVALISQTNADSHIQFIESWMGAHFARNAERYLGMPVVFLRSLVFLQKTLDTTHHLRDTMISTEYNTLLYLHQERWE
ncbi:LOW QUALITY PROTEIN: hypothetical protein NC653_016318 [Populus alba x Populus x berolinensis]|uniref:Uncharacterized protein n=1 Tax=Populus alba x Populus x berolinensis TaxID=444605 RepID=A0AAD6QMT1_9ROSI|nr:LOW QUALITY PROTEIN: hypothetical protein NC653_016318 [Populus alba x Populus x berolinensis]